MNLVGHMVRKDLRRFALPLCLWLACLVAGAVWFRFSGARPEGHLGSEMAAWTTTQVGWVQLLMMGQLVVGYILAGSVVLEDGLTRTDVFWATRPISRVRLLAAKVVAGLLLGVLAPGLALLPLWLLFGFSWADAGASFRDVGLRHGAIAIVALGAAAMAGSLGQFLLGTIVTVGGLFLAVLAVLWLPGQPQTAFVLAMNFLSAGGVVTVMSLVLIQRFLGRSVGWAWVTLVVGTGIGISLQPFWPTAAWAGRTAAGMKADVEALPAAPAGSVRVEPAFTSFGRNSKSQPNLFIASDWSDPFLDAPVLARSGDGRLALCATSGWGHDAGMRVLGFPLNRSALRWQLVLQGALPRAESVEPPQATGTLEIWRVRPVVWPDVPLRDGAEVTRGSNRMRIAALGLLEGRLDEVFIEERDVTTSPAGLADRGMGEFVRGDRHIDRYYLINRNRQTAQWLTASELGLADLYGQRLVVRRLFVSGTPEWREAVLVKVRFEREARLGQPIDVRGWKETPDRQP